MVLLQLGEVELFGTLPEWSTPATFSTLSLSSSGAATLQVLECRLDHLIGVAITVTRQQHSSSYDVQHKPVVALCHKQSSLMDLSCT